MFPLSNHQAAVLCGDKILSYSLKAIKWDSTRVWETVRMGATSSTLRLAPAGYGLGCLVF